MITFDDISGWLNQFDRSHLDSPALAEGLESLDAPDLPEDELAERARQAEEAAAQEADPFTLPEALIQTGRAYYRRGQYPAAAERMKQAAKRYIRLNDRHREGIALWLMGMAQRGGALPDRVAQSSQEAAHNHFVRLANDLQKRGLPNERRWYMDRIRDMNVSTAMRVETGWRWFGRFEPPADAALARLMDRVDAALETGSAPATRAAIDLLLRVASETADHLDYPKALVFAGRAEYDLGNLEKAAESLRNAVSLLPPRSHLQACARWMLASLLWQAPNRAQAAVLASRQAVETFAELGQQADHNNEQDLHRWYRLRTAEMQAAFEAALQEQVQA